MIVLNGNLTSPDVHHFDRIVVGVDGSDGSTRALEWARTMATITGAEVLAVHAFEYVPMRGSVTNEVVADQARDNLDGHWTEVLREEDVPYRTIVEDEDPRKLLVRVARDERADVIVIGSRGHSQIAELLLGSVAEFLTHHAPIPVVVIPADAAVSAP